MEQKKENGSFQRTMGKCAGRPWLDAAVCGFDHRKTPLAAGQAHYPTVAHSVFLVAQEWFVAVCDEQVWSVLRLVADEHGDGG